MNVHLGGKQQDSEHIKAKSHGKVWKILHMSSLKTPILAGLGVDDMWPPWQKQAKTKGLSGHISQPDQVMRQTQDGELISMTSKNHSSLEILS